MPEDESGDSFAMSADEEPSRRQPKPQQEKRLPGPSVDDRIKLAMTRAEKRFVDLELGVAEMRQVVDKFKEIDDSTVSSLAQLPELKQRIEDLEDLVMVESAGIEELQALMESAKERTQGEAPAAPVSAEGGSAAQDMQDKIAVLDGLKQHMDELSHEVAGLKEAAVGAGSAAQAGGSPLFSAKVENLKAVVEELIKRKVEIDMKIERLDKTLALVQTRGSDSLPEGLKKEIDTLNRNFSVVDSRIDAIESVSKGISEELRRVRNAAQKFESFEKASNLAKELQDKMEEFKFVENEIKRISNRVEGFYENIDQRLDKIREFERLFPQMKQAFDEMKNEMAKRLDENKISLLDRATKDETSAIRDRLSQLESTMGGSKFNEVQRAMQGMKEEIDRAVREAHEPVNVINIEITDILSRIVALETRLGNLERMFQSGGRSRPLIIE